MPTVTISIAEAKDTLGDLLNRVLHHQERIILTRREHPIAALIPIEDLTFLEDAQDKSDLQDALDALKEARHHGLISLAELKQDIGS